jgi:hypothetical protein
MAEKNHRPLAEEFFSTPGQRQFFHARYTSQAGRRHANLTETCG